MADKRGRSKPPLGVAEPAGASRLGREDWIAEARRALIRAGAAEIKVDRLARALRVTRGSFYWHFKSRGDLLSALLLSWARSNTEPFRHVLQENTENPVIQYRRFLETWIRATEFDPAYDAAMRAWARRAREAAVLVARADETRMAILRDILRRIGYDAMESEVRARVTYYHQVGYYALHIVESQRLRRKLLPTYFRVLAGVPMPRGGRSRAPR